MKRIFTAALGLLCAVAAHSQNADSLQTTHIDSIKVYAYRSPMVRGDIPNVVEVISAERIRRSSAISVIEMVRNTTPLESADLQGLKGSIELRGFTASSMGSQKYTLLLVDGMPAGTLFGASTSLWDARSIEVLKGPYSAIYGSGAMGGVVNVITPQSKGDIAGKATFSYGSYRTIGAAAKFGGSISKKFDFDASLDYLSRTDDYRTGNHNILKMTDYEKTVYDPHSYDTIYDNSSFDKLSAALRLGWDVSEKWRLNLVNDLFYSGDAPTNGSLWGVYGLIDDRMMRQYHRLDVTGSEGRHAIRVSPYFSREQSNYIDVYDSNSKRKEEYNTLGVMAQDAITLPFGTFVGGVDNFTQRKNYTASFSNGTPKTPNQPNYLNSQTGIFAQLNFTALNGHLSGIAGLRYDNIMFKTLKTDDMDVTPKKDSYNTVNPTLSLQYRLLPGMRLHAGAGRAFLAPTAYQMTGEYMTTYGLYRGNPDLKPETSVSWEAGAGYSSPSGALQADLSLFFTEYENKVIESYNMDGYTTFINANKAYMQGFDAMASFDLGVALQKQYSWIFRASWTRVFRAETKTSTGYAPARYLSKDKITFGTDFTWKQWGASLSGRYAGHKIEDNFVCGYDDNWNRIVYVTPTGNAIRPSMLNDYLITTSDYMLFDATLSYSPMPSITLTVKAANLLDELYMERDGYYMPGRNFSFSVAVRF